MLVNQGVVGIKHWTEYRNDFSKKGGQKNSSCGLHHLILLTAYRIKNTDPTSMRLNVIRADHK